MFILFHMLDVNFEGIIDSHFHILEMKRKDIDTYKFIKDWEATYNGFIIDIGVTEDDLKDRIALSNNYKNIFHTGGIHPNDCTYELENRINTLEKVINEHNVVGIGETGLDYYWNSVDKELQKDFFRAHIDLSFKYDLPIIIHDRDASKDIIDILQSYNRKFKGIIHCFSSNLDSLEQYLNLGFYISYAGNITYKKNTDLQNTINKVPQNRLLLETDSPYLSPVPMRGKLNSPLNLVHTYSFVAKKLEIETKVLIDQVRSNLIELFGLEELND